MPGPQRFVCVLSGLSPIQYHSESSTAAEGILAFCFHRQQIHQRPLWACETKRSANFVTCLWKWSPVCRNDSNDNLLILIGGPAISPWRAGTSGGGFASATVPALRGTHSWEGGIDGVMFKNDHGFSASLLAIGVKSPQMEINVNEANFWQTYNCQLSLFSLFWMSHLQCLFTLPEDAYMRLLFSYPSCTSIYINSIDSIYIILSI